MQLGSSSQLLYNGFRLSLSAEEFNLNTIPLLDNRALKGLRSAHPEWFLWWREGVVYALPLVPNPGTTIGEQQRVRCNDHLAFLVAFSARAAKVGASPRRRD